MGTFISGRRVISMNTNKQTNGVKKMNDTIKIVYKALEEEKAYLVEARAEVDNYIKSDEVDNLKFEKLLDTRTYYSTRVFCLENLLKYDLKQFDNKYFNK